MEVDGTGNDQFRGEDRSICCLGVRCVSDDEIERDSEGACRLGMCCAGDDEIDGTDSEVSSGGAMGMDRRGGNDKVDGIDRECRRSNRLCVSGTGNDKIDSRCESARCMGVDGVTDNKVELDL